MDIVGIVKDAPLSDLVIFGALILAVIVGTMQGAVRRLLGIISIGFAFLASANLRDPVGDFLSKYWTQFPIGYTKMLTFGITFVVLTVGLSIVIQGFYKKTELYAGRPIVDEALGGLLGFLEAGMVLCIVVIILDSYVMPPKFVGELDYLRQAQDIVAQSHICGWLLDVPVPVIIHVSSFLLPADLVAMFP